MTRGRSRELPVPPIEYTTLLDNLSFDPPSYKYFIVLIVLTSFLGSFSFEFPPLITLHSHPFLLLLFNPYPCPFPHIVYWIRDLTHLRTNNWTSHEIRKYINTKLCLVLVYLKHTKVLLQMRCT